MSIDDQKQIREDLRGIWSPELLLEGQREVQTTIKSLEDFMTKTTREIFNFIYVNKYDVAFWPLFKEGKFKIYKEHIRLAIKLRF